MNLYHVTLRPRDVLFFRRGRPMNGSLIGEGAQWPLPNILHEALLTGMRRHMNNPEKEKIRSLRTFGLFPSKDGEEYWPTPFDIGPDGSTLAKPCVMEGISNLPAPLRFLVPNLSAPSKAIPGAWISTEQAKCYLQGKKFTLTSSERFYGAEHRYGIGVSPGTRSVEPGQFYMASYLRLQHEKGVALTSYVAAGAAPELEILEKIASHKEWPFTLGGNCGVAYLTLKKMALENQEPLWKIQGKRVKWILKTPALFAQGWLPGWIDAKNGEVKLHPKGSQISPRQPGEKRQAWRERLNNLPFIKARLVAALPGSPTALSGWSLQEGGPKASRLAVPPGSVYYFEAESEDHAKDLCLALGQNIPRSDFLGEKGFGLGYCGSWEYAHI